MKKLDDVVLIPDKQVGVKVGKNNLKKLKSILVLIRYINQSYNLEFIVYILEKMILYIFRQSKSVSGEISTLSGRYTSQLSVKEAFNRNRPHIFAYFVIQGQGCDKKNVLN